LSGSIQVQDLLIEHMLLLLNLLELLELH